MEQFGCWGKGHSITELMMSVTWRKEDVLITFCLLLEGFSSCSCVLPAEIYEWDLQAVEQTGSLKSFDEELPRCHFWEYWPNTEKIVQSSQCAHFIVVMTVMQLPLQSRWVHEKEMLGVENVHPCEPVNCFWSFLFLGGFLLLYSFFSLGFFSL